MEIIIEKTSDYTRFSTINGNRSINQSKVDKIAADIRNGFNMLPYCPVIVSEQDGKLMVIDGQHRVEVSRKTDNPVFYVVCNTLTLQQIALLNSRGEKWKPVDFLNCYINLGLQDYMSIREVMREFSVPIKIVIDLLMHYKHNAKSTEDFQAGKFECRHREQTETVLRLTDDVFGKYTFSKDRNLIGAMIELLRIGKCDFEKLKSKIASAPMMMDKNTDIKSYLNNIERVYNFKSHSRETIF